MTTTRYPAPRKPLDVAVFNVTGALPIYTGLSERGQDIERARALAVSSLRYAVEFYGLEPASFEARITLDGLAVESVPGSVLVLQAAR